MFDFILKLFPKKKLWQEVILRENFGAEGYVEAVTVWRNVYHRNPELRDYFKRREIQLLKAVALKDRSQDFILGQIAENRLFQRFDTPSEGALKVEISKEEKKLPEREDFLGQWNKNAEEGK